ncbi:MAG TPA: type II toxin-antitoxin system VapC family toxin [Thermomicrobiales bacterium]|nr:type II toxin-antitoxin system VapC family toxin [Thermomicrobiales bacterium]
MASDSTSPDRVCVDANLAARIVMPDEPSPQTDALWARWIRQGVAICGPALLYSEVSSTIRLAVVTGRLTTQGGEVAFQDFLTLGIRRIDRDDLYPRAWELAKRYNQRRAYDVLYVALTQLEDLELWTGDERLFNTVRRDEPRVR